jgi:hypothetical protein
LRVAQSSTGKEKWLTQISLGPATGSPHNPHRLMTALGWPASSGGSAPRGTATKDRRVPPRIRAPPPKVERGCARTRHSEATSTEHLLAAAGFQMRPTIFPSGSPNSSRGRDRGSSFGARTATWSRPTPTRTRVGAAAPAADQVLPVRAPYRRREDRDIRRGDCTSLSSSVETYPRSPTGGSRELAATGRGHCPRLLGQVYKGFAVPGDRCASAGRMVDAANRLAREQFIWAFGDIAPGG